MEKKDNLLGIIGTLLRWKKPLMYLCALAVVASVIISLMMANYYKATTTFYAANPDLAKPEQVFGGGSATSYFGSDADVDRVLTVAESNEMLDFLIDSFDLYNHYEIDPTAKKAEIKVKKALQKLLTSTRTKYDAIEISVEDKDPALAARMANAVRNKIDNTVSQLSKENLQKILGVLSQTIKERESNLNMLGDSLTKLRSMYGIYDVASQTEMMTSMISSAESGKTRLQAQYDILRKDPSVDRDTLTFIRANLEGYKKQLSSMKDSDSDNMFSLGKFNKGLVEFELVSQVYYQSKLQMSYDKERYNHMQAAANASISSIHIVEKAMTPIIKERPKRSIIVLSSLLIAFIFGAIGVLFFDHYKDVNWSTLGDE